jgi:hypothetical protein
MCRGGEEIILGKSFGLLMLVITSQANLIFDLVGGFDVLALWGTSGWVSMMVVWRIFSSLGGENSILIDRGEEVRPRFQFPGLYSEDRRPLIGQS